MLNVDEIVNGRQGLPLPPCTERAAGLERGRILVVDDEASVADALRIILEDSGYEVAVALTGFEGLELAGQQCFDVVVSDVRLPDISGLEVLNIVCGRCPGCVVILITSHSTTQLLEEALHCGAFDVLRKPFQPSEVLALVSAALNQR